MTDIEEAYWQQQELDDLDYEKGYEASLDNAPPDQYSDTQAWRQGWEEGWEDARLKTND